MGDIIHTLPALSDAQSIYPDICFDWVVERSFMEIPKWHPAVRYVIPVDIRLLLKKIFSFTAWNKYVDFIYRLRLYNYDIIIDAQGLIKTAVLITYFAKGKKHGMDFFSVREFIGSLFYEKKHKIRKNQHAIQRIRQLFSFSLNYPIFNNKINYNIIDNFTVNENKYPYLIFFHSSSMRSKLWPEINWRILIKYVNDIGFYVKFPWWTYHEYLRAVRLMLGFELVEILPKLTLTQMAHQIVGATATLSLDTGLSHLSSALSCYNLTIFGPSDVSLVGTCGDNQKVICSATGKMDDIDPIYVWEILKELLNF